MSQGDDEIVFGDVTYREPMRLRRPDRDRRKTAIAYETPGPEDLPIFLERQPADAIERHALRDTSVELGGILLGKECVDDETGAPFVLITQALEAQHFENTQASFTYTHDSWEQITRERDARFPDLDIVGWYHTHPDFGVFLSSHDLFIQQHFFGQPLQVAYVVDPIRQTRGFFSWRDGQMTAVRGFYLSADRTERAALARLVNDLENLPNPEGSGSGLSPRLEAELLAMLARPHTAPSAVVDRTATAAVFSLLGLTLGALIVGLLAWCLSLSSSLRQQSEALAALNQAQQDAARRSSDTVPQARISAKEEALNTLLGQIRLGEAPEAVAAGLKQSAEQTVVLQRLIERAETEKEGLTQLVGTLRGQLGAAQEQLADAEQEKQQLQGKLTDAEVQVARQKSNVADAARGLGLGEFGPLHWAALGGWAAFLLTAAGWYSLGRRTAATGAYDAGTLLPDRGGPTVPHPAGSPREPGGPDRPHVIG